MASKLEDSAFNSLIGRISETGEGKPRVDAVNAAVRYLAQTETLDVWAYSLSNTLGYHDRVGREDIPGVIAEKMMKSLSKVNPEQVSQVRNWASYLYGQASNAVKDYLASGQVTVASGMSGAHRRRNSISIANRNLVASLGREPTRAEVIEYANAHVLLTQKNPARSGSLISEEDFGSPSDSSLSVDEFSEYGYDLPADTASLEDQVEASLAAAKLMEWCRNEFPADTVLPVVAQMWIRLQMDGERVSVIRIANETGISRASAKVRMERLDEVLEMMREFA